ncbi:PadR family transcriptional regulator [Myceligenerans crystallogenes]|uniref:PadR family transcriptional regulator n=1 Tax=Myceligenerans crystallogenes TaxID=316335 RepID=A0ABN2NLW8_9MICO
MSVRQGFLALLSERPMHGYQLRQEFERRTGGTWPLNIGQAYTTLGRLHRDGLVEPLPGEAVSDDAARPAEVFRLTDAGRAAATSWWGTPVPRGRAERDELAMKVALAVTAPGVDVAVVVQEQRAETMRALRALTRAKREIDAAAEPARALVVDAQIFAAEAEARWLDHVEAAESARGARNTEPRNVKEGGAR